MRRTADHRLIDAMSHLPTSGVAWRLLALLLVTDAGPDWAAMRVRLAVLRLVRRSGVWREHLRAHRRKRWLTKVLR